MIEEFKKFALKGNVVDLAIGVIIGAAFGKIVESMMGDVIMPIISLITGGGVDYSNLYFVLSGKVAAGTSYLEAKKVAVVLGWGQFITVAINFLIVAWVLFLAVRAINKMKTEEKAAPAAPPPPSAEEKLLGEIRDLLAKK